MLKRIADDGGNVKKYVDMAKDKSSNFRLMGFGHRVYKNYDPRATIIKSACDTLLAKLNLNDPLFEVAQKLEETALEGFLLRRTQTLSQRRLLFGGDLSSHGDSIQMFTVLFAMGRLPGWIAHWVEMQNSPTTRINRPRQIYTGSPIREFVPIEKNARSERVFQLWLRRPQ